jgi:hypothetical protein
MWWVALCFRATGTTVLLCFGLRCVFRTPLSAYTLCCFVCLLFSLGALHVNAWQSVLSDAPVAYVCTGLFGILNCRVWKQQGRAAVWRSAFPCQAPLCPLLSACRLLSSWSSHRYVPFLGFAPPQLPDCSCLNPSPPACYICLVVRGVSIVQVLSAP